MNKEQFKALWDYLQSLAELRGGLYVDAFAVVILIRLIAPMFNLPAMTAAEAGCWAATISAFAFSHGGPKQS